jgi:hypothetical protein
LVGVLGQQRGRKSQLNATIRIGQRLHDDDGDRNRLARREVVHDQADAPSAHRTKRWGALLRERRDLCWWGQDVREPGAISEWRSLALRSRLLLRVHLSACVDAGRRLLVPYERLADALCELGGSEKGIALKLTVDSSESLDDALRVVGALYGVTLVVSDDGRNTSKRPHRRTTKPKQGSVGTNPRTRVAVADTGAGRSRKRKAVASAEVPSNAEVRSWARRTGLSVSDRGRVPASVMAAYRSAH